MRLLQRLSEVGCAFSCLRSDSSSFFEFLHPWPASPRPILSTADPCTRLSRNRTACVTSPMPVPAPSPRASRFRLASSFRLLTLDVFFLSAQYRSHGFDSDLAHGQAVFASSSVSFRLLFCVLQRVRGHGNADNPRTPPERV